MAKKYERYKLFTIDDNKLVQEHKYCPKCGRKIVESRKSDYVVLKT